MIPIEHWVVLVEEPSMEAFLRALLPRLLPEDRTFEVHAFQGKRDLLGKLAARLRAYATWLPNSWRIVVVVDRDEEDCHVLKAQVDGLAASAGLRTRSNPGRLPWQIVNRIAIEELEAWYFGDWAAVHTAYPRVPRALDRRSHFREPDAITGGTWEAFERVLKKHGYFTTGLRKVEAARAIGPVIDPARSRSASFRALVTVFTDSLA